MSSVTHCILARYAAAPITSAAYSAFQVRLVRITEMVNDAYYPRLYLAKVTALPSKLYHINSPF
jgi:hypothetical protein